MGRIFDEWIDFKVYGCMLRRLCRHVALVAVNKKRQGIPPRRSPLKSG